MNSLAFLTLFALCAASMAYSARWHRSLDDAKPILSTRSDPLLANVSRAAAETNMDVKTLRLDEAAASAKKLKNVTLRAEKDQKITREDAADIYKAADKVQKAAESGDHEAANKNMVVLHKEVDDVFIAKDPKIADNLEKHNETMDKPVLSSQKDMKILRDAVAEVVEADPLVPPEKKKEATDFTVRMIKDGFDKANTTNQQLVNNVDSIAAKNKTGSLNQTSPIDRDMDDDEWEWRRCCERFEGHEWERRREGWEHRECGEFEFHRCREFERHRFGRQIPYGGLYDPAFYYGYGYRSCLYGWPFDYCRGRLFGDYAFHHGFHHFFHHHRG
jgi:hypothetical protein